MSNPTLRALAALALAAVAPSITLAQRESPRTEPSKRHAEAAVGKEGGEQVGEEAEDLSLVRPSLEVMASGVFRTASAIVPIIGRLAGEVHFYGLPDGEPRTNVAQLGASWHIPLGRIGFVAPGVGYYTGADHAAFSLMARWSIEKGRVVSEGLLTQGIDNQDGTERGQFWDGNHVSLTFLDRRLEVGPTWEHIHIRDEDEWKAGGRVAVRVMPHVLAQLYAMAPGKTEWRGGIVVR